MGHNFVHEFLVRKREAISHADKDALMEKQQKRCAKCNDLLSRWEVHHDPTIAEGGSGKKICLVCPRRQSDRS